MSIQSWARAAALVLYVGMCSVSTAAKADGSDLVYSFATVSGTEVFEDSYESYQGIYLALNGDLDKDGLIFRVVGSYGQYDFYDGTNNIDADYTQGDALLGYQIIRDDTTYSVLVGVGLERHSLSPASPSTRLNGSEVGFKVAWGAETERYKQSPLYWAIRGDYTTAFDTYYTIGRIGYDIGRFVIGPEGWLLGDDSGDAQRVGAFALYDLNLGNKVGTVSVSAGYQFVDNHNSVSGGDYFGEEGAYGTVKFTMGFGQ